MRLSQRGVLPSVGGLNRYKNTGKSIGEFKTQLYFTFSTEEEEEPLLIYTAQGSPFRCKKLSVINGSPERNIFHTQTYNRALLELIS